jgi:hypothetical protein
MVNRGMEDIPNVLNNMSNGPGPVDTLLVNPMGLPNPSLAEVVSLIFGFSVCGARVLYLVPVIADPPCPGVPTNSLVGLPLLYVSDIIAYS